MTKSLWRLVAIGVIAYAIFFLATLPASVLADRVGKYGVQLQGVDGSVWHGSAASVQASGVPIGQLEWRLHPLSLLRGRLSADVDVHREQGGVSAAVQASFGGSITISAMRGSIALASLPRSALPGSWSGTLNIDFKELALEHNWPLRAIGEIRANDLTGPAQHPQNLGAYALSFADDAHQADGSLLGKVRSLSGPLNVSGTVRLMRNETYVIEGQAAAQPGAPQDVVDALQVLGPPDANGQRRFSIAGSF